MQADQKGKSFIQSVVSQIRFKEARRMVARELEDHLEQRSLEFLEQGLNAQEAEEKAVACMGDPMEVGENLNRIHRPKVEWTLILSVLFLTAMGIAVLLLSPAIGLDDAASQYLAKNIVVILSGAVLAYGLYRFDYTLIKHHPWILFLSAIGILVAAQYFGTPYNGVKVFVLPLTGFLKPDHLCSLIFILAYQGFMIKYRNQSLTGLIKIGLVSALSLLALLAYPSFSSMLITLMSYLVLLTVSIWKKQFSANRWPCYVLVYGSIGLITILMLMTMDSYRLERIGNLFHRSGDRPQSYTVTVIERLLSGSKPLGTSTFIHSDNFSFLPGSAAEFAFTTILATMGWVVGIGVCLVIGFFLLKMGIKMTKTKSQYGYLMALSMLALLGSKFLVSILGGTGLINGALTGMPFVSYGMSDYLIHMAAIGLFLSVLRTDGYLPEESYKPSSTELFKVEDGKLIIDLGLGRGKGHHEKRVQP